MRSLAGTDVVPRLVADKEWRLGALTVIVGNQRAQLRYARESVGSAPARATDIASAWRRALDRLETRSLAPEPFLARLTEAYSQLAADRVLLVELRAKLADYTRAQFAWDVARLRRERRLVVADGRRVDLGIATGHAASRRSRVVWIEDEGGGGAFYESFRLITREVRS
jgi:hypothetical protein